MVRVLYYYTTGIYNNSIISIYSRNIDSDRSICTLILSTNLLSKFDKTVAKIRWMGVGKMMYPSPIELLLRFQNLT